MATILRAPLITPVRGSSRHAALLSQPSRGPTLGLLVAAVSTAPFKLPVQPNPGRKPYPVSLLGFTQNALFSLINVNPAGGVGWMDTPDSRRGQQSDYTRNSAILAVVTATPFNQTDWPNPQIPDRRRRGFEWYNARTAIAPSPTPFAQLDWPNPRLNADTKALLKTQTELPSAWTIHIPRQVALPSTGGSSASHRRRKKRT